MRMYTSVGPSSKSLLCLTFAALPIVAERLSFLLPGSSSTLSDNLSRPIPLKWSYVFCSSTLIDSSLKPDTSKRESFYLMSDSTKLISFDTGFVCISTLPSLARRFPIPSSRIMLAANCSSIRRKCPPGKCRSLSKSLPREAPSPSRR
jgi:hypothetical protein